MASSKTINYGLNKWERDDLVDVDELNYNFDQLDLEVSKKSNSQDIFPASESTFLSKKMDSTGTISISQSLQTLLNERKFVTFGEGVFGIGSTVKIPSNTTIIMNANTEIKAL